MPILHMLRSKWRSGIIMLLLLEILSGCNPGCCWLINCFPTLRRPQVMKCTCDDVIDFEGDCPEYEDYDHITEIDPSVPNDRKEITPEDLEPRVDPHNEYRLAIGNLLEISLFGEDELDVEQVLVASDGNIYYSLLDPIPASGKTLSELVKELEIALSKYYKNPLVAVNPLYFSNHNVKVLGRVRYPGQYRLDFPMTIRDALAQAGGLITEDVRYSDADIRFRSNANLKESFIVRNGKKLDVDFHDLFYSPDSRQNIYVRPNDYIYIAPIDKQRVFVLGAIRRPRTVPFVKGLTLMGALTAAAGWETGFPYSPEITKVLVLRGSIYCPRVIEVDVTEILAGCALDVYLAPGDIVYASDKVMRFGRELIHLAVETFLNSFGTAAGSYYANVYWLPPPNTSDSDDSGDSSGTNDSSGKRFRR